MLERVLAIQAEVNREAERLGRPQQWVIPPNDERRIRELIAAKTWPRGWKGDEPDADEPMHTVRRNGTIQLNMLADLED
jgi:DNA sulfur modification protein DndC